MYKYIYAFLLSVCLFFLPCCTAQKTDKSQFNAYLPRPFEDFFEEPIPLETKMDIESETWDTADIDVSYIDPNRKLISFTFDDAPAKTLENILAVFAEYNENNPDCKASATLFVNGGLVAGDDLSSLYAASALGFEMGNHTQAHFDLTTLTDDVLQAEINVTDQILSRIDGKKRHLLRAPFGRINDSVKAHIGAPIINWTIDTLDWSGVSAGEIYNSVFSNLFSGSIVLMHDGYQNTIDALKRLLPDLKNNGYQVVSVSALAKMHQCTLRNGGEYIRLRKQ